MVVALEIENGFQKTDIGIIPSDWQVMELVKVALYRRGSFPQPYGLPKWYDEQNGMPFVQVFDVDDNMKLKPDTKQKISDAAKDKSVFVPKGSVVLTIQGSIGRIAITQYDSYVDRTLLIFKSFLVPMDKWYFMYVVHQKFQIEKLKAPGGTIKTITKEELSSFQIPLPPTKAEQTAIANALNDADQLISELEKLIAKKKNIRQGAMQELLSPKEGWAIRPFREVSYMKGRIGWQGLKQSEFTMNPEQPFLITGMNFKDGSIRWNEVYHVPEERYAIAKEIQLKIDDVLFTKDGTIGKLLFVSSIPYPYKATLNSHLLVFRPLNGQYYPKFLYYQLGSKLFRDFIELRKTGTTFFGLSQDAVGDYPLYLPKIDEQKHIANTLTSMDEEIEALERKLEKHKMIKQGMMQNLLTGKIRLI